MQRINHPFVMSLRFAFTSRSHLYMVQDFFSGGELMNILRENKKLTEDSVRIVGAEIYLGLKYLHSRGIIYRDLKPENILLDSEGHCCITDFGMSKELLTEMGGSEKTKTFCGTPEYLSPEMVKGEPHDRSVDLWGFGVLLYHLSTGSTPFASILEKSMQRSELNFDSLYQAIQVGKINIPNHLSPALKDLLTKLLVVEPTQRLGYNNTNEISSHLFFSGLRWTDVLKKKVGFRHLTRREKNM